MQTDEQVQKNLQKILPWIGQIVVVKTEDAIVLTTIQAASFNDVRDRTILAAAKIEARLHSADVQKLEDIDPQEKKELNLDQLAKTIGQTIQMTGSIPSGSNIPMATVGIVAAVKIVDGQPYLLIRRYTYELKFHGDIEEIFDCSMHLPTPRTPTP